MIANLLLAECILLELQKLRSNHADQSLELRRSVRILIVKILIKVMSIKPYTNLQSKYNIVTL